MTRAQVWLAAALCAVWPAPSPAVAADAVADFYAGKTVHVLIGYSAGGGYDLYARMLARHMGKHIPGNPQMLPENMPGAGSLKVVNFLYGAAPKDGATFGTFGRGVVMEPLLGRSPGAKFEATKFTWIGSVTDEVSVCAFHARTGIKTFADLKASKKPVAVGGTGPGSNTDIYATLVKNALGAPIKLVTGYPGGSELNLAIQQGELDGRCGWSWSSLRAQERDMYESKQIALVAQIGLKRHPEIGDVPLVTELTDSPNDKAMMRLIVSREAMARPFAAPPGIPADRAKALRDAFDATMKDAEFLAEAERLQFEVRPMTGAEVESLVKDIYASPPEVVNRATEVMKPSK